MNETKGLITYFPNGLDWRIFGRDWSSLSRHQVYILADIIIHAQGLDFPAVGSVSGRNVGQVRNLELIGEPSGRPVVIQRTSFSKFSGSCKL